eukprot:Skav220194  [mRNA]  locus=scaffold1074:326329:329011:- [translate_table: standard]
MVKAAEAAVILNVYALVGNAQVRSLQPETRNVLSGAGALHVAVEVAGTEWSYGAAVDEMTGIFCHQPRQVSMARHGFMLGGDLCDLDEDETGVAGKGWHFAMALVHKLGVGTLPSGLNRLGRQGPISDHVKLELRSTQQIPSEYRNSFQKGLTKLSGNSQ